MDQSNIHNAFYIEVLNKLIVSGEMSLADSILVVNGGQTDASVLQEVGFEDVTISNLDERVDSESQPFAPYDWSFQDTEKLTFTDEAFDFVLVHSGLHHLRCPELGITQMYRVAKKGIVGFEPHDCAYTRLGVKLGLGQDYEIAAVYGNNMKWGGVANTAIPNLVYRFSAKDIRKTIQVNNPIGLHMCQFFYATRMPSRLLMTKNVLLKLVGKTMAPFFRILGTCFPALANNIAFYVRKNPPELFPWLKDENGNVVPDVEYLNRMYEN